MSETVIYHNSRCSKSRATLELLRERGIEPVIIEYLNQPPDSEQIAAVAQALDMSPPQFVRFGEGVAKELGISADDERPDAEWFELIAQNPILLERPIVVVGSRAAIGRPPEQVLGLFD